MGYCKIVSCIIVVILYTLIWHHAVMSHCGSLALTAFIYVALLTSDRSIAALQAWLLECIPDYLQRHVIITGSWWFVFWLRWLFIVCRVGYVTFSGGLGGGANTHAIHEDTVTETKEKCNYEEDHLLVVWFILIFLCMNMLPIYRLQI